MLLEQRNQTKPFWIVHLCHLKNVWFLSDLFDLMFSFFFFFLSFFHSLIFHYTHARVNTTHFFLNTQILKNLTTLTPTLPLYRAHVHEKFSPWLVLWKPTLPWWLSKNVWFPVYSCAICWPCEITNSSGWWYCNKHVDEMIMDLT